ncbi:MAG: (2E,6E)-farnesyl diphosphate synthase [Firmicutes bacterium]|nr:(2E,6E)-farnesyl diphosphate synthase [Bacillota bacterium]
MDIRMVINEKKSIIDDYLEQYLSKQEGIPQVINEAVRYSLFAGGKRLRPILVISGCEICGGEYGKAIPIACAIEMIHTYSLIHDDLPAMDNDDYRRGKPTNHKVYGEGIAVLAGDALLNSAFELMLGITPMDARTLDAVRLVARAAGVNGMIGGQVIDLECEGKEVSIDVLEEMHNKKTGALINASILAGALVGGCSDKEYYLLKEYGSRLGLAFQIRDDILDVIGNEKILGKKVGSDAANKKSTFVTLLGLQRSKEKVAELAREAKEFLRYFGGKAGFLAELTDYLVNRDS